MKYILLLFTLLPTTFLYSQTVNDIPLGEIESEYVQIVGTAKMLSTKVTIDIDFGQHNKVFQGKDTKILDEEGKPVVLNSMIDALNFMIGHGYEYVDAYTITLGNQNVYHYLLRKED